MQVQGPGPHPWLGCVCSCSSDLLAVWCPCVLLQQAHGGQGFFSPSQHLCICQKQFTNMIDATTVQQLLTRGPVPCWTQIRHDSPIWSTGAMDSLHKRMHHSICCLFSMGLGCPPFAAACSGRLALQMRRQQGFTLPSCKQSPACPLVVPRCPTVGQNEQEQWRAHVWNVSPLCLAAGRMHHVCVRGSAPQCNHILLSYSVDYYELGADRAAAHRAANASHLQGQMRVCLPQSVLR